MPKLWRDRWPEKGGGRASTQLSRALGFLFKNFFLIGTSPANLYAGHLYFTPPGVFNRLKDYNDDLVFSIVNVLSLQCIFMDPFGHRLSIEL